MKHHKKKHYLKIHLALTLTISILVFNLGPIQSSFFFLDKKLNFNGKRKLNDWNWLIWYLFGEIADCLLTTCYFILATLQCFTKFLYINLESGAESQSMKQHLQPILKETDTRRSEPGELKLRILFE